jgi:hypothetical protein
MLIAERWEVSVLEAIIIYLSAGAPFGALAFFSRKASGLPPLIHSIIATVGWPIIGAQRIYRKVRRRGDQKLIAAASDEPLEVLRSLTAEVPIEPADIFNIAGHPNPWLATVCYSRSRKKLIRSHIERLTPRESHLAGHEDELPVASVPPVAATVGT